MYASGMGLLLVVARRNPGGRVVRVAPGMLPGGPARRPVRLDPRADLLRDRHGAETGILVYEARRPPRGEARNAVRVAPGGVEPDAGTPQPRHEDRHGDHLPRDHGAKEVALRGDPRRPLPALRDQRKPGNL